MDLSCKDIHSMYLKLLQKKHLVQERKFYLKHPSYNNDHFALFRSYVVRVGVTMTNAGVAPFYYPLTLNAKAVDTNTRSIITSKSISVPIVNQLDQLSFIYYFDMAVQVNSIIQFSIWLNSTVLIRNQAIVFSIMGASVSGVIQLPPISIGSCPTESFSAVCMSYIMGAKANDTQGTYHTNSEKSSTFNNPCAVH